MDRSALAALEVEGLVELSPEEAKKTNGGFLVVAAFAVGFAVGCCYNKITSGYWIDPS